MPKNYQSIILYKDMAPQVLELTEIEAGKIYQAIFRYACYGEDTDFSQADRFVRSLWETTKLKIQAGEEYNKKISETNRNNINKRWLKVTGGYDGIQSNTEEYDGSTYTNTITDTNTFTVTKTDTEEKNILCPEPKDSAPDPSSILLPLVDKTSYDVPVSKIEIWTAAYPAVDIRQELYKMAAWLESNPQKRKTRRGIDRFINNWLSREQDSGRNHSQVTEEEVENKPYDSGLSKYSKYLRNIPPSPDDPFQ